MPDQEPYVPSSTQIGLPETVPLKIQLDTDTRLNNIFNPALTKSSVPTTKTDFSDFFDTRKQDLPGGISLRDGLFSDNPKIKNLATNILQAKQDPTTRQGLAEPINTPYDQAAKYLGKEFGFTALTDNEDMYANYKNSGVGGFVENAGKFVGRTVGSAILKLGQGVSGLLAMPLAAVEPGHFWSSVSDNALVQLFDNAEKGFKDQWLPVYQAAAERNQGFFQRMFNDSTFWTSDFSDGLGFMLSAMVPTMGLSKIGLAAKLGEGAEILNYGRLGVLGKAMKFVSGANALTATGVDELGSTILNVASEAFFEAKGVHDSVVQKYSDLSNMDPDKEITLPNGSKKAAKALSKDDIETIASHGAKNDFAANFPILMFSDAWETNLLYKAMGKSPIKAKGLSLVEDLTAQVEKPTSKIGQLLNGRLGFYTKKSVEAAWWEGLWEENAQLAAQRLNDDSTEYDHSDPAYISFAKQMYKQTKAAFEGKDPEAASSIGLGVLMGVGAGNALTATSREYSKEKQEAVLTAARLNNLRNRFLTGDIYQKGPDGEYIHDDQGKMVVDQNKLNATALQSNNLADKAKRIEDFKNPEIRNIESQLGFVDYFQAAILAGKDKDVLTRLEQLKNKSPEALAKIGFDPEQQKGDSQDFIDLGKHLQDIHKETESSNLGPRPDGVSSQVFTEVNMARKAEIYRRRAAAAIYGELAQQKGVEQVSLQTKYQNGDNSSLTDDLVTNLNTIRVRQEQNQEMIEDQNTTEKTRANLRQINTSLNSQLKTALQGAGLDKLQQDAGGFYHYEKSELDKKLRASGLPDATEMTASMENMRDLHQQEATNIGDPKTGFKYFTNDLEKQTKNAIKQPTPSPVPTQVTSPPPGPTTTTTAKPSPEAPQNVVGAPDTAPDPNTGSVVAPGTRINSYEKEGEQFVTKDPEGLQTNSFTTEEEAKAATTQANKDLIQQQLQDKAREISPTTQEPEEVIEDNQENLQKIQQQANEENNEFGKMIVNSLSIATKAVDFDSETGVASRDDEGRPRFNYNQDSIIDFGVIVPGTKIYLKLDTEATQKAGYRTILSTEGNSDLAQIRIYTKGETETTLGYLHTLQGARRLLTQNVDMQAELLKLSNLRNHILSNPNTELEAQVTQTGFGFPNKGDNRGYKTIDEATYKDNKAILAVKKGNSFVGEGGVVQNTRFGNGIKEGATVLMLPNNVNGSESLIPIYVAKKSVATDQKIRDIVEPAILSYLSSGNKEELNQARDYIYITSSGAIAISLTNNGLFLNPNGELIFRGKNITDLEMNTLLSQLLVNINEKKLNNSVYVKQWRNSPAIQTTLFARMRPDTSNKSYFHQHTIQFTDPLNKTQSHGKSSESRPQSGSQVNQVTTSQTEHQAGNARLQEGRNDQRQVSKPTNLPEYQDNTRTADTKKILDYFAQVTGEQPFTGDLSSGGYIAYLKKSGNLGHTIAGLLNSPQRAANAIEEFAKSIKLQKKVSPADLIRQEDASLFDELKGNIESVPGFGPVETEQEKIDRLNQELAADLENNGFILDDLDFSHDISEATIEQVTAQPSTLLIKGFNAFVQEDAINSISQLLLSDGKEGVIDTLFGATASNKDRVSSLINSKLDEYNKLVEKYAPLITQRNPKAIQVQNIAKNLQLVKDNFEVIHQLASERLNKLGITQDEQGYYSAAENDNDFLRYDDDSEYTRNNYDSISRLVKQFISFNSEKIEKDGKIGNRLNSVGLPQVVQSAVVYNKIMNWISDNYFAPTFEGFQGMVDHLSSSLDPTIKDIAQRLSGSKNAQLKFQFFANMLKFKTDHIQQLITIKRDGVFARNIEANRNQITKVVFDQLSDEFLQKSKVLVGTQDEYGNTIYRVDKLQVQPYMEEFIRITKDKDSYGSRRDQNGQPTGIRTFKPEAAEKAYGILKALGFNFSQQAFVRAIGSQNASNPKGDAQVGLQTLFTGGNKILRNMAEGEGVSQERDLLNPFIANPTEMNQLARVESSFRTINQTDSFRSNGKSYYPFTRMSFIKSIFQQISSYSESGQITPLLQSFTWDPFKSASRFLQRARNDASFAPKLEFARGNKETGTKSQNQEVKDMNDKDFIIGKVHAFQNSGNKQGLFFSDTYSDKTTRFQIKADKEDINITFDATGKARIDATTIDKFFNYFQGELRRVNQVRTQNQSLPGEQRISGFHDSVSGKEGIGKYFVVFNYLNHSKLSPDQAKAIYDDNGVVKTDPVAITAIKNAINDNLVNLINRYQVKLERYGMFSLDKIPSSRGINDSEYYKGVSRKFDEYMGMEKEKFIITADYLLNSSLNSLEMLTLTGDPAQSPKVKTTGSGSIRLDQSIKATLTEVSKRNASLNAPFDQGINVRAEYKVGFLQDLKINSDQVAEYKALLPSQANAVEAGYKRGDMTDAQEATTVKEHMFNLLSLGRISPVETVEALAHFDPEDFEASRKELISMFSQLGIEYTLDLHTIRRATTARDMTGYLGVIKPVQRYSRWDENLGMVVETYIKTSSFPLVPALVKGKDFEEVLRQMKASGVDRINFASGTKQGLINPQSIYSDNGTINPTLFANNTITLPAAAWGEQVQNPEKEALKVTEGSQQQRLIFVDLPDNATLTYKGQPITGKELRQQYVDNHRTIFQTRVKNLFDELGVESTDGVNNFTSLGSLSDILQREGVGRDYDRNTLLSLNLNKQGQFEIPLTFLPNASEIQALVAAVVSNRILKNKLPGTSLIQGSEMVIKTNGKVKVSADITQAPTGSIVWTKPEYASISKLQYIRVESGEVKPAQIVLPFYFKTKDGKSVRVSDYTNTQGFLDTSKIDPELLEINGFRIPYAGPNSGMWFEVVGYLPETMGSLVIVPAEVAAQMGADYDVDKLFTYVLNHTIASNGIRVDNSSPQKQAENDIIQAHKAIYLSKDRLAKTIEPTGTDELDTAIERNLPKPSQEIGQIYDPSHQDEVWLSNRAGQLGISISANFNTFHSVAQQAHLFTKGTGVKFLDKDGALYNETTNGDERNSTSGEVDSNLYKYGEPGNESNAISDFGINRLDRINTFPNPYTGQTRAIASIINNWLQASVDNAKLQLLGSGGINKLNFNVALTIALHGFDSDWIIPFINQPILKEYYSSISGLNDKFNKDFSADRKGGSIADLFKKYVDKLGVEKYNYETIQGVSHVQLLEGVDKEFASMNKSDIATQLDVLKQFLNLDKVGSTISGISADTKVEVNGLSKSFSEINQQAKDIAALGESVVGGVERLVNDTVSGVYLNVPGMIDDLFNHPDNPLFAYSTPVYQSIGAAIETLTGKNLGAEELDNVYKDFKQFIYTHPSLGLHSPANSLNSIKQSFLSERKLVNSWQEMKAKYPNSILLNQLSSQTTLRESDPGIITMQSAADDIATQIKQEWLDFFKSTDPALVTFINQLTTYSLLFGSKEYGPSNMLKYIPFEVLKGIGFGDNLNTLNRQLTNPELFYNFLRQYIQHNQEQATFLSNRSLPKNTLYQQTDGKPSPIPSQFTLPEPSLSNLNKFPAYKTLSVPGPEEDFQYRKYIRTYVNEVIGHTLYELQSDGLTYRRIDTLGNQYINEYDFANPNVRTIFPLKQAVQTSDQVDTAPPAAAENPNPTTDDITGVYAQAKSVNDVLDTVQLRTAADSDPIAQLHHQLASALAGSGTYSVAFTEGIMRGVTRHTSNSVEIHPQQIARIATSQGVSYEQLLQQTLLHEAIHVATDRYLSTQAALPASKQSPEFKEVSRVWDEYRRNLVQGGSSSFVRGIQDSFLQAELFKTLYDRFRENRKGDNHEADIRSVFSGWDTIKTNRQELLSIVYDLQQSMQEAHTLHNIGKTANFDLVKKTEGKFRAIDTERVAQIVDYLDTHFTKELPGALKEKYYAYVSPQEFNTMTMTSSGFMNHLNSVDASTPTKSKTLWDRFKDIIRKIVSSFNDRSLLPQAIDAVMDITKAATREKVEETTEQHDTPPWENNDTPAQTVVQTIPTINAERSFTFSDGITIPTPAFALNNQQKEFLQVVSDHVNAVKTGKQTDRLFTLSGYAGTGKSSSVKYLVQYLNKKWRGQITFKLSSPTHKANKVLGRFFRGTINEDPITTKSILGYKAERDPVTNRTTFVLDEKKNKIPANGVLIIDEASFIGQKEFQDILAAAAQKNAIIIFMGDIAQIPSPDGSNKVSPAFGLKNQYQLTKVERQTAGNPLAPIYDIVRNNLLVDGFAKLFPHNTSLNEKGEGIQFILGDYKATGKLLTAALQVFKSDAFKTNKMAAKIVAYGNPTVEMYNREVRQSILPSPAEDFQIGELLMGYTQKQQNPLVQNGQDYVIADRQYRDDKVIDRFHVSGFELKLKEADEDSNSPSVPTFLVNPKDLNNQPFIQNYVDLLEKLKNAKGYEFFQVMEQITKFEEAALIPETIYSYQNKAYTNSMLRESFPTLFKYDEQTGQRPIDKMTSIEKNIDYGYAVTAHKVQGSTYINVFIDENNLEFDKRMIQLPNGQPFSYERNNLLYVALSRPTTKATVLSKNTLSEANTYNVSPQELQQTRNISNQLNSNTPVAQSIEMQSDNIEAIKSGRKTITNRTQKMEDGIYRTPDGSEVSLKRIGYAQVVKDKVLVYKDETKNNRTALPSYTKNEFAKKEGFNDWTDFDLNNKFSTNFVNGSTARWIYEVKSVDKSSSQTQLAKSSPELNVSETGVDKIRKGLKTLMSSTKPVKEGTYFLKDGTKVQIAYNGEVVVDHQSKTVLIGDPNDLESPLVEIPFDEYARKEGYANWADFEQQATNSKSFIEGKDVRNSYNVKVLGANYDLSIDDTIKQLKEDNLLKQNC